MEYTVELANCRPHRFRAMGCEMTAWLELDDADAAQAALQQVEALFAAAERRLSRFRPTSELTLLNGAPERWVPVSDAFWQVFVRALQLAHETDGLFDPTLLGALEAAGYDRDFAEVTAPMSRKRRGQNGRVAPQAASAGWREVRVDPDRRAVWLPAGVRVDLGGIAKGYTAQLAAIFLGQWGPCLVDAGGDLVAGDPPAGLPGWPVGIAVPWHDGGDPAVDLARLWLRNVALATSGVDYRRWLHLGQWQHHLIDPRRGAPAVTDLWTVSVVAADAASAEAWAKVGLILGAQGAKALFATRGLAGAWVTADREFGFSGALAPHLYVTPEPVRPA